MLRRFTKRIYVRLPGREARLDMLLKLLARQDISYNITTLQHYHIITLSRQHNDLSSHEVHQVAQLTQGYSGSDLASLARWSREEKWPRVCVMNVSVFTETQHTAPSAS